MNKVQFKSRKEVSEFLKEKGIDTSSWNEEKWLSINKGQADIHISLLAEKMYDAYNESTPKQLQAGEWHIPFGDNIDNEELGSILTPNIPLPHNIIDYSKEKIKIATARCARISYQTLGDNPKIDYEADIKLHDILAKSGHWSPFEHCAKAMTNQEYYQFRSGWLDNTSEEVIKSSAGWCRNFRGFIQYRHIQETTLNKEKAIKELADVKYEIINNE